jgi:hypothetical protein
MSATELSQELDFPGFSGYIGVLVRLFRTPQDLHRLNDYGGALDCRKTQWLPSPACANNLRVF